MAKKRERKPIITQQPPEPEETDELFAGILGNPLEVTRTFDDEPVEGGTLEDAVSDLLGLTTPLSTPVDSPVTTPESYSDDGIDEYARKKVLTEMYGTETPSEYDIISLAIRNRL